VCHVYCIVARSASRFGFGKRYATMWAFVRPTLFEVGVEDIGKVSQGLRRDASALMRTPHPSGCEVAPPLVFPLQAIDARVSRDGLVVGLYFLHVLLY